MISEETTNDILGEINRNLDRIASALEFEFGCHVETPEEMRDRLDPFHDEGNATNHRLSQCTERCKER